MNNSGLEEAVDSDILVEPVIQRIEEFKDSIVFFDTNMFLPNVSGEERNIFKHIEQLVISNPEKLIDFYEKSKKLLEFFRGIIENNDIYVTDAVFGQIGKKGLQFKIFPLRSGFRIDNPEERNLFEAICKAYSDELNLIMKELKENDRIVKGAYLGGRIPLYNKRLYQKIEKRVNDYIDIYEENGEDKCGDVDRDLITELLYMGMSLKNEIVVFSTDEHIPGRLKFVYGNLLSTRTDLNKMLSINIRVIGMEDGSKSLMEYASTRKTRMLK